MIWLRPVVNGPPLSRGAPADVEARKAELERNGQHLRQFGPRGSKAYQREAKRMSRARHS